MIRGVRGRYLRGAQAGGPWPRRSRGFFRSVVRRAVALRLRSPLSRLAPLRDPPRMQEEATTLCRHPSRHAEPVEGWRRDGAGVRRGPLSEPVEDSGPGRHAEHPARLFGDEACISSAGARRARGVRGQRTAPSETYPARRRGSAARGVPGRRRREQGMSLWGVVLVGFFQLGGLSRVASRGPRRAAQIRMRAGRPSPPIRVPVRRPGR